MTRNTTIPTDGPALRYEVRDGIATLTIDNPARMNALTAAMWGAIPDLITRAGADPAVRVVVVRGAGTRAFSAGADISEFETARAGQAVHAYDELNHAAFAALSGCVKPVIAMIHGFCLGGGLGIALACDLRVASTNAQFAIPAAKLGIGYNPRWIGPILRAVSPTTAKLIMFTGRRFNSEAALEMGLLTEVVRVTGGEPGDPLAEAVTALATEIAANAPLSVAASKAAINELSQSGRVADVAALDPLIKACFDSADYAEGRRAFMEKRKPLFTGR